MRHLNLKIDEHIGISPLSRKQVKPNNNSLANKLLFFQPFRIIWRFKYSNVRKQKVLLKLNKSLLIMRDQPSFNREITLGQRKKMVLGSPVELHNKIQILPYEERLWKMFYWILLWEWCKKIENTVELLIPRHHWGKIFSPANWRCWCFAEYGTRIWLVICDSNKSF